MKFNLAPYRKHSPAYIKKYMSEKQPTLDNLYECAHTIETPYIAVLTFFGEMSDDPEVKVFINENVERLLKQNRLTGIEG